MQAGKFDQRITISVAVVTGQNSYGEDIFGVPTTATYWAEVRFLQGRELEAVMQRWADARYLIDMRRQPGVSINRKSPLLWNGLNLDIVDVQGPGTRMGKWTIIARDLQVA